MRIQRRAFFVSISQSNDLIQRVTELTFSIDLFTVSEHISVERLIEFQILLNKSVISR